MPRATSERGPAESIGPIVGCSVDEQSSVFDLAVIGGGIYGVSTLLEASRRGLRAVLLEADDFGSGVSWSSHRIIHGGLRYLQSLDFVRFRESVRERRWFVETFPDQIAPLGCIVPLSGRGTKRAGLFACAAVLNNGLNAALGGRTRRIAPARLMSSAALLEAAPGVRVERVRGVGYWQDGLMISSERVLISLLRRACDLGGRAMRGVRVAGVTPGSAIRLDATTDGGDSVTLRARRVINCAGPASGTVGALFGGTHPALFKPLRAFNVLLDVEPRLRQAVALESRLLGGRMLFVVPGPAGLAIGTWEEPDDDASAPSRANVERLLEAGADVLGRSDLSFDRLSAVWSGRLPRAAEGSLTPSDRPVVVDHGRAGGLHGAYSVSGVKFTTARLVAERAVTLAFPDAARPASIGPIREPILEADWLTAPPDAATTEKVVQTMVQDEEARTVDDVCRRRSAWYTSPDKLRAVAHAIGAGLGMDAAAAEAEVEETLRACCAVRG